MNAFEEHGWDFVLCGHFNDNPQSRRVIEKCGFVFYKDTVFHTRMGVEKEGKLYMIKKENYTRL